MFSWIIRLLMAVIGGIAGNKLGGEIYALSYIQSIPYIQPLSGVVGIGLGAVLTPFVIHRVGGLSCWIGDCIQGLSLKDVLAGAFGLITGLVIGLLLTPSLTKIPLLGTYTPVISLILGYIGALTALRKKEELFSLTSQNRQQEKVVVGPFREKAARMGGKVSYKLLDTSVIIDGRIYDICKTCFIEGVLLVPAFVIEELQHIADSADLLRRNRGRRGLDVLNRMQKEPGINIQIYERDIDEPIEVDSKLLKLARLLEAKVVTNDYNLNKVAELHGVDVLNINELANAVKPVVLPGEEMLVHVIKDGKESGQGVAYLDDGTMIVVDGGRRFIGEQVSVMVTSVLQTAAGRMIFAKLKVMEKAQ